MKRLIPAVSVAIMLACACAPATKAPEPAPAAATPAAAIPYGANKDASGTFVHEGVTLYYEIYGQGEPLLLVHGNGGSLGTLAAQIDHFKAKYKVIAMDSRDQGKSSDSAEPITYEKMTDDLAALIDHLKTGPVDVVGWSDGGIEALLLGVRHPDKVKKIVSMAANLNPGPDAFDPEIDALIKSMMELPDDVKGTPAGERQLKVVGMMLREPNIAPALLGKVTAPTLVLAADHDLIRLEHMLTIYKSLPNAQLAIFSNSTHLIPYDDPATFNAAVERFLTAPFRKIDRIPETMGSFEKLMTGLPQ
ncbi:MAG: alpha/beta hydrolase [Hyphomonadaceae bacterium]|nr:alpha/beta hydrolase [Hyphomonadaceae bacterium]